MSVSRRHVAFGCFCAVVFLDMCNGQNQSEDVYILRSGEMPSFNIMSMILPTNLKSNISEKCAEYVLELFEAKKPWALEMLDAMGKLPAGILQGSLSLVGSYDQCLGVSPTMNDSAGTVLFKGQYCIFTVQPENTLSGSSGGISAIGNYQEIQKLGAQISWHSCFPSKCSPNEVENVANKLFERLNLKLDVASCEVKEDFVLTKPQLIALAIFFVLGLVLLVGTLLDVVLIFSSRRQPSPFNDQGTAAQLCRSFSLYTNALKILNVKTSSDNLGAINGIRFLSMTWIILAHTYTAGNVALYGNIKATISYYKDFPFQVVMNGTVSVDVFFFLSGLLMTYISVKELRKNRRINWFLFYFHRFWRLSPGLGFAILVTFLIPLLGSGPFWNSIWSQESNGCRDQWWTNMLYINNFFRNRPTCLGHTWYLANDMQFFVVSPIIIYLYWRWSVSGLIINTAFLLMSIITPALIVMRNNYPPTLSPAFGLNATREYNFDVYIKPWCRMSTYCIGIYIGFLLTSKKRFKLHPLVVALMWCLSIATCVAVVYGVHEWNKGNASSNAVNSLYAGTHRPAFALGIAWMTYACCTGYGGIVNRILSWKVFIPLGRMTYMAYLFHPFVILSLNFSLRERIIISQYYIVVTFLGFLFISYAVAFVTSIALEAPFIRLEKNLLYRVSKKPKETEMIQTLNVRELEIVNGGKDNEAFNSSEQQF